CARGAYYSNYPGWFAYW
nr:immunoglobulin heavy chain junction region [Mus musculus]MBK4189107.1 immunoglobulin heavy chain junction region [Mus musculus]MBK4189108.1 immunoglobulin heavy chain junction region [Mus musculus]